MVYTLVKTHFPVNWNEYISSKLYLRMDFLSFLLKSKYICGVPYRYTTNYDLVSIERYYFPRLKNNLNMTFQIIICTKLGSICVCVLLVHFDSLLPDF